MSLVLSRREEESLVMFTATGEQIIVSVSRIADRQVKLCIDAPDSVLIMRNELLAFEPLPG